MPWFTCARKSRNQYLGIRRHFQRVHYTDRPGDPGTGRVLSREWLSALRRARVPQAKFDRLKELYEENLDQRRAVSGLFNLHIVDPRFLEFVLSDEMLDLVEPVMGPNIGTWTSAGICKPPRTGKATPWHEDSAYWKRQISNAAGICSVWLAIDEATPTMAV